jgi:hypothetical protein
MNHGKITANADQGDGGAIFIRSDYFINLLIVQLKPRQTEVMMVL